MATTVKAPRFFRSPPALLCEVSCKRWKWASRFLRLPSMSSAHTRPPHLRTLYGGWRVHSTFTSAEEAGSRKVLEMKDILSLASSDSEASEVKVLKEIQACTSMNEFVELLAISHKVKGLMRMQRKDDFSKDANRPVKGGIRNRWFPYMDAFRSGDTTLTSAEVLQAMDPHLLDSRKERFKSVVNKRSYSVSLVVEGLTDFGNVSAAFRSADALGIQSVHVISRSISKRYRENRNVSMGAEKWLDVELWGSTRECFRVLKSRGYQVATACLGKNTVSILDMDWSVPTAVVVGNEHSNTAGMLIPNTLHKKIFCNDRGNSSLSGVSEEAGELADLHCSIPVTGMVDSFNVSVASGIIMHHAVCHRNSHLGSHGDLTPEEQQILLAEFCLRHGKGSIDIAHEFVKRKGMAKL